MSKTLDEIKQLVKKLEQLGVDPEEFSLWLAIYDTLPQDHQLEFSQMLENELKELQDIENEPETPTATPST